MATGTYPVMTGAMIYAGQRDKAQTMKWLEQCMKNGMPG